jgi:hypothetical protein
MVTTVNGVDVLLSPEMLSDNPQELRDPSPILDYARHAYDVVIADTGSVYGDWNLNQARLATDRTDHPSIPRRSGNSGAYPHSLGRRRPCP